jgi:hypothetical protein
MKFRILTLVMLSTSLAYAEPFNPSNNPQNFSRIAGTRLITKFSQLPSSGELSDSRRGWSESYWPSNLGGIAYRWNHPNPQPFKYRLHSKSELLNMSREELEQLSPAELYDIANGDYNYTLTKKTFSLYNTRDLWWEGICHGWAQAATNYPEPSPVLVRNKDGIRVPFGASDIKALLAMHDAYNYKGSSFGFVGVRCRENGKVEGEGDERDRFPNPPAPELANSPECSDVNAGSFHVVLSNMIGIHGRGFVADIDRYNDVWNQPITNYTSSVIRDVPVANSSNGVTRKIHLKTVMTYGEELKFYTPELEAEGMRNFVSKKPVTGTPHQIFKSKNYEYILELNSAGEIIGGEWISETRPDFMWLYSRHSTFKNSPVPLAELRRIYRPVKPR